ncbi:MAG: fatty acid desaturase [Pseudomonadota bacterium]|nr:fatty acid desaturase [Pseudomonadota bacterium]
MDLDAFSNDLQALGAELRQECGEADLAHLRRMERWGRLCSLLGWATAWIAPNPVSILALSTGRFARWTMVGHHVGHRGYDRVGGPSGKGFGEGGRRLLDWFDWLVPAAWKHEHNVLHHYRLNEARDPDLVEENLRWLRESRWPLPARYLLVFFFALTWKWLYYAPNTIAELHREDDTLEAPDVPRNVWTWDPRSPAGRDLWLWSVLPFASVHFVLLPGLFLLVSPWAAFSVLLNQLLAELLTNLHSFLVIVPNHAGGDLYRFDTPARGKREFLLRQVLGSANFRTGGDLNDFAHGYLNYQIEHHLWPDLPMAAYQRAQPRVKALCARHGVPYVQESVWRRVARTVRVMVGEETMLVHESASVSGAAAASGARASTSA